MLLSVGDLIDRLVIENIKIFTLRDKLKEIEQTGNLESKEYVEIYEKMMILIENRAEISNLLDEKVDKVTTGKERNKFLKRIRTFNET